MTSRIPTIGGFAIAELSISLSPAATWFLSGPAATNSRAFLRAVRVYGLQRLGQGPPNRGAPLTVCGLRLCAVVVLVSFGRIPCVDWFALENVLTSLFIQYS
ncbi:hypothetical protein BDA96_03G409900 [Sorghum bicolor]|uniref:Uncharacterized protein n=1 Tax=Sorghum bicolor TaxID=4558 RepID=A0A921UQ36_SORBI|nr:hypothetical protein BDA96_03G409900 [Sorghum bicolor]